MEKDTHSFKILVIEDNFGDYILIEEYLNQYILSPSIYHAPTFALAEEILSKKDLPFDIILLDLSLPDNEGEDLIKSIVSLSDHTPVVALTGLSDMAFSIKSLSMGVLDYLLKNELNPSSLYKSLVYNIERKKTATQLEDSNKRYSDLFHFSPLPMWVIDVNDFKFLDVNESAISHYGFTRDEFKAMSLKDICHKDEFEAQRKFLLDNSEKESDSEKTSLFRHKIKSGASISVEVKSSKIQFGTQEARLVLSNDITERIKHLSAIEDQNKKLRNIAWTQSHVVRAPLARIMGLITLIEEQKSDELNHKDLLGHITQSAHELDSIIRKIAEESSQIKL
jgi:PAS domain S-box-containing protein